MACEEKERLLAEYTAATAKFSASVAEFSGEWERRHKLSMIGLNVFPTRRV